MARRIEAVESHATNVLNQCQEVRIMSYHRHIFVHTQRLRQRRINVDAMP